MNPWFGQSPSKRKLKTEMLDNAFYSQSFYLLYGVRDFSSKSS
jgi:hypothetical protein